MGTPLLGIHARIINDESDASMFEEDEFHGIELDLAENRVRIVCTACDEPSTIFQRIGGVGPAALIGFADGLELIAYARTGMISSPSPSFINSISNNLSSTAAFTVWQSVFALCLKFFTTMQHDSSSLNRIELAAAEFVLDSELATGPRHNILSLAIGSSTLSLLAAAAAPL